MSEDFPDRFAIEILETDLTTNTETKAEEIYYSFFTEALLIVHSLTAGYWVDENRVALAKGEEVTYELPKKLIKIKIRENT